MLTNKTILITGGTGSFGNQYCLIGQHGLSSISAQPAIFECEHSSLCAGRNIRKMNKFICENFIFHISIAYLRLLYNYFRK